MLHAQGPRLQGPAAPAVVGEELGRCLDRVAALQQEHAAFAGSVQQQLASLRTAPAAAGGEAERLQRALAASEQRATEDRSLTAAALERLAQQVDALSARLDQLAAAPPEPGGAQEAMQQVEARLEEVAAVQERQAAELLELRQAPGSCAQTESAGRTAQQVSTGSGPVLVCAARRCATNGGSGAEECWLPAAPIGARLHGLTRSKPGPCLPATAGP